MSTVIESAHKMAADTKAKQEAERSAKLAKTRRLAIAVVLQNPSPDPAEIVETCDALGVGVDWFERCVVACQNRLADVEGLAKIPELQREVNRLQTLTKKVEAEAVAAEEAAKLAFWDVKNMGDGRFSIYRRDVTPGELATHREARNKHSEASDRLWLVQRDAALIEEEIRRLEKIDHQNIDPGSSEPSPHNFKLPPLA